MLEVKILEMLKQKEEMECRMAEIDEISVDDYLDFRNEIIEALFVLRPGIVDGLTNYWYSRYNYIDRADIMSYVQESIIVAIENFRPSRSTSFNSFMWNICGWSVKTIISKMLSRKEVPLPEYAELEMRDNPIEQFHKKMLIEQIHAEVSDVCKKIMDGLNDGFDYAEIGESLIPLTGRKLFPSEISYWVKTIRLQYADSV